MQMKTKRLSSVFAGKLNVNMKPTLAAAKFKNQQTKKQSEILEQEEEEEDIISSGNAYLIRGLGEVIFGISADLQGVPYHWAHFVFVIFSGSRTHTEELFIAIG